MKSALSIAGFVGLMLAVDSVLFLIGYCLAR